MPPNDAQPRLAALCAAALISTAAIASPASAQVFGSGPSDPALFTDGVFNIPPDTSPGFIEDLQQLNLADGGSVGDFFVAFSGSEVNISGGTVGIVFRAESGSEVNISGGTIGDDFMAESGSEVNISGGTFNGFVAFENSEINISDGTFGSSFGSFGNLGGEVNISGGTFGSNFIADFGGSEVNLFGTEFFLNDQPIDGLTFGEAFEILDRDLTNSDLIVLSGTLADGSAFDFSLNSDEFNFINDGGLDNGLDLFAPEATLTVTLVVPEPAAGGLLLAGMIAIARRRRRARY